MPRTRKEAPADAGAERVSIINLKGTREQAEWLDAIHRATHIPRSALVRVALDEWAARNGHPPFPGTRDG